MFIVTYKVVKIIKHFDASEYSQGFFILLFFQGVYDHGSLQIPILYLRISTTACKTLWSGFPFNFPHLRIQISPPRLASTQPSF